jgi:hypothetical protein
MKKIIAMAIATSFLSTAAMAEDLSFVLTNLTGVDINEFYVSHSGSNHWEENLLAGAYLPSGNEVEVWITDGRSVCEYDIQAVFADGDVLEDYELDLCDLGSYTFQ